MTPKLTKVVRLDSMPLIQASFTPEGYLKDRPIVTSTGIFEYLNPDGSTRMELRLPEEVFAPESLASYRGKPVVVTHDAGEITKDNVAENQIGTILSDGYRSGDDVRAEIVIHDTDAMKDCGLKELSLGYSLDLDETPGVWNGQHYDAIQRNIRINHLALVREARAGDQARLNIDGRDSERTLKGGKAMKKTPKTSHRADGVLTQEEFAKAIEEYKQRRAERMAKKDEGEEPVVSVKPGAPAAVNGDEEPAIGVSGSEKDTPEQKFAEVKENRDRRDAEGDPEDNTAAMGVIAQQDEDMSVLFDIIDTLLAEREFKKGDKTPAAKTDSAEEEEPEQPETEEDEDDVTEPEQTNEDEAEEELPEDEDETEEPEEKEDEDDTKTNCDDDDADIPVSTPKEVTMNADSIDAVVRQRIQLGMMGRSLNLDGLENMSISKAKKAIINAVRPSMRLDGKSETFINAAYEMACSEVNSRSKQSSVAKQKKQMFNKDAAEVMKKGPSALTARQRMIDRMENKKEDK